MARLNLPSAKRTVRRGVGVCKRMGYTEDQALSLIMIVCSSAAQRFPVAGEVDMTWLAAVYEEARCQQRTQPQRR